ncbi:hypothetical protein SDC9_187870 [bioreactor metagenome]|uniref:Uncharacterized protein n=1 Tax=bioreactor metagenome TaxID=1076179 RepID=A0A645HVY1_9ZZZZ
MRHKPESHKQIHAKRAVYETERHYAEYTQQDCRTHLRRVNYAEVDSQ